MCYHESNMKKYFSFVLLLCLISPLVAKADMLPDNSHVVSSCLFIDNLRAFPDYAFVIDGISHGWTDEYVLTQDNEKDCLGFLQGDGTILAVKKSDVNLLNQKNPDTSPSAEPVDWIAYPENQKYFIPSNLHVNFDGDLPDSNPIAVEFTTVMIDSVNNTKVTAHIVRHTFLDKGENILLADAKDYDAAFKATAPYKDVSSPTDTTVTAASVTTPQPTTTQTPTTPPTQTQQQIPAAQKPTFYSQLAAPLDTREIIFIILGLVGLGFAIKTWKN